MIDAEVVRLSGWAGGAEVRASRLSYLPRHDDDDEPPYAVADAWTLPHELALPSEVCERVRHAAERSAPTSSGNGTYYLQPALRPADRTAVVDRFAAANDAWWRLDVDRWHLGVKRYRLGEAHPEHQDLHAGAAGRKLAGLVQLSQDDAYSGGDLLMRFAHHAVPVPRALGTLVAFPGWTCTR